MRVVMKFGGTSVADPEAISRLIAIVSARQPSTTPRNAPLVVVSALAGVTDGLVSVAQCAERGDWDRAADVIRTLEERHLAVAEAVTTRSRARLLEAVRAEFRELTGLVHGLARRREVSRCSQDAVLALGELVSSRVVAAALADHGVASVWVDARTVLATDDEHGAAAPDMAETCRRARARLMAELDAGRVPVTAGFIGATAAGVTSTLGRGGSDYSASIFGACLDVEEIQIWTDVDGMLTADPRLVPDPRVVPQLSFAEASELAYFGAKVLHPSTIQPAVSKNIPVRILNARAPGRAGTLITAEAAADGGAVTAIACKRGVTVIDITSTRMLMAHGFLRRLFEVFERFRTAVDVVTTSEVSVSVTVDDTRRLEGLLEDLRRFADARCEPDMAIVCAVGRNLGGDPTLFARAVAGLAGIPLRLVSQAASRHNITFVVPDADAPQAMVRLHQTFFR
jgi:aspartate kinase